MLTGKVTPATDLKKMVEAYMSSPVVKAFLAGSLSGTCSTILFQPLDLVKTRIQCAVRGGNASNSGLLTVVANVVRNERLVGLWKGVVPSLTRTVPGIGVYFSTLHTLKTRFGSKNPRSVESFLLGLSARAVSGVAMLPFTVVKTRFESGQFDYRSVVGALRAIWIAEGARGLYSGLSATLLRDAPFSGLYLMFYTKTRAAVNKSGLVDGQHPFVIFQCGLVAGVLASVITQPADVIKTHMQVSPQQHTAVYQTMLYIQKKDGVQGFLRGVVPRTLRRALMAALAWTMFEGMMKKMGLK